MATPGMMTSGFSSAMASTQMPGMSFHERTPEVSTGVATILFYMLEASISLVFVLNESRMWNPV